MQNRTLKQHRRLGTPLLGLVLFFVFVVVIFFVPRPYTLLLTNGGEKPIHDLSVGIHSSRSESSGLEPGETKTFYVYSRPVAIGTFEIYGRENGKDIHIGSYGYLSWDLIPRTFEACVRLEPNDVFYCNK